MTRPHSKNPAPFSASTSWVGILLLGAGLSTSVVTPTHASSPGPATASVQWSGIDDFLGVLSGGQQRDFIEGTIGWQSPAFHQLGLMGLEWTTASATETRRAISPDTGSQNVNPGGESSWTTPGYLSANPNNLIYTDKTLHINGNQVRFDMRHYSLGDESAINRRIYWVAGLAAGYDPVYSGAGTTTLLIRDAQGNHPTLILHANTAAGTASFQGGTSLYTALADGDRNPTLYVIPGDATDFTMSITIGIVDADPCSSTTASSFAGAQSGVFGEVWGSITSCIQAPSWSVENSGEPSPLLVLNFASPYSAPLTPTTRELILTGLPQGVTWERQPDQGSALRLRINASTAVEEGTYIVGVKTFESLSVEGLTTISRASSTTGTLLITALADVPAENLGSPGPNLTTQSSAISPTAISASREEPIAEPTNAATPLRIRREEAFDIPLTPTRVVTPPRDPAPEFFVSREPRRADTTSDIPEPLGAGAWLGLGTALLAGGGIFATLRRRLARQRRSKHEAID